ncbi:MAG: hypothetical protein ABSB74_17285 [Tepidisphaeraceae bacterium]
MIAADRRLRDFARSHPVAFGLASHQESCPMRIIIFLLGLCILMTYLPGCFAGGHDDHGGGGWDHHDDHGGDHHDDHH